MEVLTRGEWLPRAHAHAARVDAWIQPHLERRRRGERHPVHDFLFGYYSHRPAALRRWHPGYGVVLLDAPECADAKGYGLVQIKKHRSPAENGASRSGVGLGAAYLETQRPLLESTLRLLAATASRPASFGCFGLHEWAMVHGTDETRHAVPLRLGRAGTDAVVESHRISCSHFDAFRFFTPSARPLNTLTPGREDRPDFEQPGCLHAGMDLYGRHASRLSPLIPSELVADAFELAWDLRILDMRASPYDFSGLAMDPTGELWAPIRIETPDGKREYVELQRRSAELGASLRSRLVAECERLLSISESLKPAIATGRLAAARPVGDFKTIRKI